MTVLLIMCLTVHVTEDVIDKNSLQSKHLDPYGMLNKQRNRRVRKPFSLMTYER